MHNLLFSPPCSMPSLPCSTTQTCPCPPAAGPWTCCPPAAFLSCPCPLCPFKSPIVPLPLLLTCSHPTMPLPLPPMPLPLCPISLPTKPLPFPVPLQPSSYAHAIKCPLHAHLGEQVVNHMGANVMVDLVEDAEVPVQGGQAPAQVAPLLRVQGSGCTASCQQKGWKTIKLCA